MNTRQSKVKPIVVEVAIRNAIARRLRDHGVAEFDTIATEVTVDLFGTRVVPTPDGVPTGFIYQGTHLDWPQGVDTRAVTADEAATYTRLFALKWNDGLLEGESVKPPVVTTENNADHLRNAYTVLWNRVKHGKAQVESPPAPAPTPRVWEPVANLPKNDGRAMAAAFEHLRMFGAVENIHDPAECLNAGKCMHPDNCACALCYSEQQGAIKTALEQGATLSQALEVKPKRKKAASRKKVQPVVPTDVVSQFDQDMADLDALMDSL